MKKVLLTATVQSHICQFHKPLVSFLHKNGYEVHVAAKNNLAEKNGLKLDFVEKVFDVPFSRSPKSKDNVQAYKKLKKIIEQNDYEIVHCNTPMGGIVTRLAARKSRKKKNTKVYYTAHGFHFYKNAPKKNWIVYYPIEKFFSRFTDKLITITEEDYHNAKKSFRCEIVRMHGVGVSEERYHAASDGEKKEIRAKLGIDPSWRVLLCIGELLPNKNQSMIIRCMPELIKKNPKIRLLIAGNGKEDDNLKALVHSLGMDEYVTFLGYVTNLEEYQKAADLGISCSKREGLPLNIVEAMLSGNPVVATDNRGHRELIVDGETGFIVPVDDVEKMQDRIMEIFENVELESRLKESSINRGKMYTDSYITRELVEWYLK